jgi:energy-coupling factor transporter ATP-binding protein EcfA2
LRELEELWLKPGQVDSVLLYGHRRMGKSSILKNLHNRLDPQRNWVVEFNLQRVGKVSSTGELLYAWRWICLIVYRQKPTCQSQNPDEASFLNTERNPYQAFNRWLKQLEPHMENRRFIITIDEFELLEVAIAEKRIEAELIEYMRGQINTREWFVIALAGLYTLQEKTREFWFPLFGGIKSRKVSFLLPDSTRRLITQPSPDFPLNYTEETIQEIIRLTNGQPYLVQLIGQSLVARFNHRVFEAGEDPDRPISIEDLQAVIHSPEFFQDGGAYFTGVWGQAEDSEPAGQTQVLKALCQDAKTLADLATSTGLSTQQVEAALATLTTHDVVRATETGEYTFTVELMRRWVEQRFRPDGKH